MMNGGPSRRCRTLTVRMMAAPAADAAAYHGSLHECGDQRSTGKAGIPHPTHPVRLVAELKRHASEDETREHEQQRQVKCGHQRRVDDGKGGPQEDTGCD